MKRRRVSLLTHLRRAERAAKQQGCDPRTMPVAQPAGETRREFKRGDRVIWKSVSLGELVIGEVVETGSNAVKIRYTFAGKVKERYVSRHQLQLHRP